MRVSVDSRCASHIALALTLWLLGTSPAAGQATQGQQLEKDTRVDTVALLDEARAFMDSYARDLRAGDRTAVAARYDRAGAFQVGMGRKALQSHAEITAQYAAGTWQPPTSFAWQDLSYEALGPDAVLVVGRFEWGLRTQQPPIRFSYTGILRRRRDGALRIRLEDESADPASLPPAPKAAPRDSSRP
jgi:ketosteroid isomerase-like protein